MSVQIDFENKRVSGTNTIRQSGRSAVITIPPEVIDSMEFNVGDEVKIEGDWGESKITLTKTE